MSPPARAPLLRFWMCVALVVGNSIGSDGALLLAAGAPAYWLSARKVPA